MLLHIFISSLILHRFFTPHSLSMKAFDVESDTVVLPTGMIEYKGQMCKLKIPKIMDQKAVKKVDLATEGLFRACKHIFAAQKLVEFCSMAPFLIDTEKKQIQS